MKKISYLLLIILIFSCKEKTNNITENSKNGYSINATISNLKDSLSVILNEIDSQNFNINFIDSTLTNNGSFKFQGQLKNPRQYELLIIDYKAKVGKRINFWIENGTTSIIGSFDDFENAEINGSSLNKISKQYNSISDKFNEQMNEKLATVSEEKEKMIIYNKFFKLKIKEQIDFNFNNPNNYISLSNIISFKNSISKDSLQMYYSKIDSSLQNSGKGLMLKDFITTKKIQIGEPFKDFDAKDLDGNPIKLSDFKGKVILLDFWASWCHWCHVQNKQEFSYLNKKYNKDKVVIISYYLDTNKELWEKFSKDDNIEWINISNLKGYDDHIANYFDIKPLPNSFLFNQNGILIKSFEGYDSENNIIEQEIDKLLE